MNIETFRIITRRKYMKSTARFRFKTIINKNFTILSNNCWAGFIYQSYKLPYLTPTIGLFFMAEDYILFLENLDYCLNTEISFIDPHESKYYSQLKDSHNFGKYPIGIIRHNLDKIEIHFLHYNSKEEAINKWNERKKRINMNKLIIKFNDQNCFNESLIERFENLPYKNKIFFGSKKYSKDTIYIKVPKRYDFIPTSYEPFGQSWRFNVNHYLNTITREVNK